MAIKKTMAEDPSFDPDVPVKNRFVDDLMLTAGLRAARVTRDTVTSPTAGATIVNKFFHLMWEWRWPTPVTLKEIEDGPLDVKI
ncbi:polynucleotide adenylyltransferase [Coniosporium tulheliwenetii]|uniref:Polynucleotide adenylyltransferase n=1 Tax=Coniosporium tulheliwenetii TaxID=3383036 RepID=A0ACC2YHQ3_9PEZI|nr:polynucleotide adenylyltransferase [Cladosporium sp. JES 115]